jgi:hypothetical protein
MGVRPAVLRIAAVVLLVPACLVLYHVATVFIGTIAEPMVAPTNALAPFWARPIIDHFHIEASAEILFIGAALLLAVRRSVVWLVGSLLIPIVPHLVLLILVQAPSLPGRSEAQDFVLWSLEGIGAGVVCCLAWEAARACLARASPLAGSST